MDYSHQNGSKPAYEMTNIQISNKPLVVAILGTGEFGRALGTKIQLTCPRSSVKVIYGSRNSKDSIWWIIGNETQLEVLSHEAAIAKADVIIVAVPAAFQSQLPLHLVKGDQILVDCSNSLTQRKATDLSNAEKLAALCPGIPVVKAFNVLSAYSLASRDPGRRTIPIASDDSRAKEVVSDLIKKTGFIPEDEGLLISARGIEAIPLRRFDSWHLPLAISTFLWFFYLFFIVLRSFCFDVGIIWSHEEAVRVLRYVNKASDNHALGMLSLCFLPGVLAAYLQLYRNTKYSAFPNWLDRWLRMRKHFGLLMLFTASVHACSYLLTYQEKKLSVEIPIWKLDPNGTELILSETVKVESTTKKPQDLLTNAYLLAGVIGFGLAVILGITSLPSVSKSLSWQEFRLIQSRLGWACLVLCTLHCVFKGWKNIISFSCGGIPSSTQLPLYLPAITILLKLPLLIPFVDSRLTKIRAGLIQGKK